MGTSRAGQYDAGTRRWRTTVELDVLKSSPLCDMLRNPGQLAGGGWLAAGSASRKTRLVDQSMRECVGNAGEMQLMRLYTGHTARKECREGGGVLKGWQAIVFPESPKSAQRQLI